MALLDQKLWRKKLSMGAEGRSGLPTKKEIFFCGFPKVLKNISFELKFRKVKNIYNKPRQTFR